MGRIALDGVTKRYGNVTAVKEVTLEVESDDLFSFVGPSGCGKTTLLRMIAGLERPDAGRIWIGDRLVSCAETGRFLPPGQRGLGMVFQSYALWPHMTVNGNIAFGLKARRRKATEVRQSTEQILDLMQIPGLGERYPNELSGGQQQRVALAREFVTGADTLLMDEPLSNLDARLRMDMRSELKRLHQEMGVTMVYVTHDQLEALTLSTRIAVMKDGTVQQLGTPDEVYFRPATLFVSEFIGLNPINLVRYSGQSLESSSPAASLRGEVVRLAGRAASGRSGVVVGLRPEFLKIEHSTGAQGVAATVETVLSAGPTDFVQVLAEDVDGPVRLMVQDFSKRRLQAGQRVRVDLDAQRLLLFDAETLEAVAPR